MRLRSWRSAVKQNAIRLLIRASGAYLRNPLMRVGKRWIWQRICVPHLSWRDEEVLCRTRFGHRFFARPNDFVENRLCFFGIWEPAVTRVFERLLGPGDVVVDVGANVGYYSLLASHLVGGTGHVYAVEASPLIRERLNRNLLANGMRNVSVLPYAAWDENGSARLHVAAENRGSSTLSRYGGTDAIEAVSLVRLDKILPEAIAPRIRLLKIDVEGAEAHAVRGLAGLLERARRAVVICEITPSRLAELGSKASDVFEIFERLGYTGYRVENDYTAETYIYPVRNAPYQPVKRAESPMDVLFVRDPLQDAGSLTAQLG